MSGQHDQHRSREEDTTDLAARYAATAPVAQRQHPWWETAGAEEHVRTRGRFLIISGLAVGVLTFVLAAVYARGFNDDMPITYLLPLYAISFGAVAIGGMEYLSRPNRYSIELNQHKINELQRQVTVLVGLLSEEMKQQYYRGMAEGAKMRPQLTGTEDSRSFSREHSGDVLRFRRR